MSKLDIAEKRKPQDGKIRFKGPMGVIELRVATIPTAGGNEDIVMRILAASKPLPLEKMGFSDRNIKEFKTILEKPYGIALVVGPDVTDTDWDSSSAPADENSDRYDLSGMGLNFTDQRTGKVCIDFLAIDSLLLVMKLTLGASGEERSVVSPILVLPNDDEADTEFDAADFCSGD